MDETEIINLHKRCNKKARKAPQSKKASGAGNEKRAAAKAPEPKKVSGSGNEKGLLHRPQSLKKHQSHLNLLKQTTQVMKTKDLKKQGQAMKKILHKGRKRSFK